MIAENGGPMAEQYARLIFLKGLGYGPLHCCNSCLSSFAVVESAVLWHGINSQFKIDFP
jgi:hypothetical protein